jgi:hypothetical protein
MSTPPATAESWKISPMPQERQPLDLELTLLSEAYGQIQLGYVPQRMEDKWFIYFEDGWLNFHRSWTGSCIYRLRFKPSGKDYRVSEAWVNHNPAEYKSTDAESDRQQVRFLIDNLLLRRRGFPPVSGGV